MTGVPLVINKKLFKQGEEGLLRMVEKITLDVHTHIQYYIVHCTYTAFTHTVLHCTLYIHSIHTYSTTLYMHSMLGPEELEVCQEPEVV